jgi:chromosome segregation ATPase
MADWAEQYLAALRARDEVEKANAELYDYCARLADQKAELQKQVRSQPEEKPASPPPTLAGLRRVASPPARPESPSVQIRQDLAKAQQERADLQTRLDAATRELEALKSKSKAETRKINHLTANVSRLEVKLQDRNEELKGKAKLVENVQDENVTLNLQLNMADEQAKRLKKENQDYINRLMARKGKEADRMNDESKFG